jgi:hypothetical protein
MIFRFGYVLESLAFNEGISTLFVSSFLTCSFNYSRSWCARESTRPVVPPACLELHSFRLSAARIESDPALPEASHGPPDRRCGNCLHHTSDC